MKDRSITTLTIERIEGHIALVSTNKFAQETLLIPKNEWLRLIMEVKSLMAVNDELLQSDK